MRQMNGYILLWVLCCLQLLSAISLYELDHLSVFIRATKHHQSALLMHQAALIILKHLEDDFLALTPTCVMETSPVTWSEGEYNGDIYRYSVELLDANPCDFFDMNHTVSAKYYRITLKLPAANKSLQSVIACPQVSSVNCQEGKLHQVKIGRQQWREVS